MVLPFFCAQSLGQYNARIFFIHQGANTTTFLLRVFIAYNRGSVFTVSSKSYCHDGRRGLPNIVYFQQKFVLASITHN